MRLFRDVCVHWRRYAAFGALASYLALIAHSALAHEWFTHKTNPVTGVNCCDNRDCVILKDEDWWRDGDKFFVRWSDGKIYSIPAAQAQPSEDRAGKAAGCVLGDLRCFFYPAMF